MRRRTIAALLLFSATLTFGAAKGGGTPSSLPASSEIARSVEQKRDAVRVQGERRFRTNCGRCHQTPHKFPPPMMGTIIRHMRVRAMLTDEDTKTILAYMTE